MVLLDDRLQWGFTTHRRHNRTYKPEMREHTQPPLQVGFRCFRKSCILLVLRRDERFVKVRFSFQFPVRHHLFDRIMRNAQRRGDRLHENMAGEITRLCAKALKATPPSGRGFLRHLRFAIPLRIAIASQNISCARFVSTREFYSCRKA